MSDPIEVKGMNLATEMLYFGWNEPSFFPHIGTRTVIDGNFFYKTVVYTADVDTSTIKASIIRYDTELFCCTLPILYNIELIFRRTAGVVLGFIGFCITMPICITASIIRLVFESLLETSVSQKIKKLWNDHTLVGDFFTTLPSRLFEHAARPLTWHLDKNGRDKSARGIIIHPDNKVEIYKPACCMQIIPFEFFEFVTKRITVGTLALTATLISPIGLIFKLAHQTIKSV